MDEKYSTIRRVFDNQKAFTLVELIVVVAIIGILAAMSMSYLSFIKFRSADSHAFVEGRHLVTAVNDAFLNLEDVNFNTDGLSVTGPVGDTTFTSGGLVGRTPIFTLSPELRAILIGQSTPQPGGGAFFATIWNVNGSPDPSSPGTNFKKYYNYNINEDTNEYDLPNY